jgi:acetyl-CoA decarbonylase/synthase complex subunit delta
MSEQKQQAKAAQKPKVEYGEPRPQGVAGPNAAYVEKSLSRWRLRGDGVMARK